MTPEEAGALYDSQIGGSSLGLTAEEAGALYDSQLTTPSLEATNIGGEGLTKFRPAVIGATARNILDYMTLGGADEIIGGGNAAIDYLFSNPEKKSIGELYDSRKAQSQLAAQALEEQLPDASTASKAVGLAASLRMPLPGVKTNKTGIAGLLSKTGQNAAIGAGLSELQAGLSTDGDLMTRLNAASEAAPIGALFGAGAGLLGEGIAGTVNLAKSGYNKIIGPQTVAEAEAKVGETLAPYVGTQDLKKIIRETNKDPLGQMRTSAEVLQSPELAILEQRMAQTPAKAMEYANFANKKTEGQDFILSQISKKLDSVPENTGSEIQDIFQKLKAAEKKKVSALYEAIPKDQTVKIYPLKKSIQDAKVALYGKGAIDVPKELNNIFEYITNKSNKNELTIQELQRLRSRAGSEANVAQRAGDDTKLAFATTIKNKIAEVIDKAPEGATEWRTANEAYKKYAEVFKNKTTNRISKVDGSSIQNLILKSPESTSSFKKIVDIYPEAINPIKDQLAADLSKMSDAQKLNFFKKNNSQLKALLPKEDFAYLKSIKDSISSRINTSNLANVTRGSNTALKLSDVVERALTGKEAVKKQGLWTELIKGAGYGAAFYNPLIGIPAVIGNYTIKAAREKSGNLVQDALFSALQDPRRLQQSLIAANKPTATKLISSDPIRNAINKAGLLGLVASIPESKAPAQPLDTALSQLVTPTESDQLLPGEDLSLSDIQKEDMPKPEDIKLDVLPTDKTKRVRAVENLIDSDPIDSTIYEIESSRNPNAKNPDSSASGGFQLLKKTASNLGVKDVFDLADNYKGYLKLKEENQNVLSNLGYNPNDAEALYSLHYLGAPVFKKLALGKSLNDTEQSQVDYLETKVLPKFRKIYTQKLMMV